MYCSMHFVNVCPLIVIPYGHVSAGQTLTFHALLLVFFSFRGIPAVPGITQKWKQNKGKSTVAKHLKVQKGWVDKTRSAGKRAASG